MAPAAPIRDSEVGERERGGVVDSVAEHDPGLVAAPIVPLTPAFFAGRLVSYSIYVTAASAAKHSLGSIIQNSFTSPAGIALQLAVAAVPRRAPSDRKGKGSISVARDSSPTATCHGHLRREQTLRLIGHRPKRKPAVWCRSNDGPEISFAVAGFVPR